MNRERLEIQIDVLRKVKPGKFDMNHWIYGRNSEPCGTACCAFGYAALDKRLRAQGLGMTVVYMNGDETEIDSIEQFNKAITDRPDLNCATPTFGIYDGVEAAAAFYDLPEDRASWLFDPIHYRSPVTPQNVIDRIVVLMHTTPEPTRDLDN